MQKDRFGDDIIVAWAEHELIWVAAAMTLDCIDRPAAFQDIADITGRSVAAIRSKGYSIEKDRRDHAGRCARRVMVPAFDLAPKIKTIPASEINTCARMRAMRMGARA